MGRLRVLVEARWKTRLWAPAPYQALLSHRALAPRWTLLPRQALAPHWALTRRAPGYLVGGLPRPPWRPQCLARA